MGSSTSSSSPPDFARTVPTLAWARTAVVAFLLASMALLTWEHRMRALGLRAGDLGDGKDHWVNERRKVDSGPRDQVVLLGDSRLLFDTDLDVWQEVAGVRPLQLALAGTPPHAFLEDLANDEHFAGLAVVDVTELVFFDSFRGVNADALAHLNTQSPSQRAGHALYVALSERVAFLDENYTPLALFERLEVPNRRGIGGPYMDVWKISEATADRQTFLWPRIETDARLREHARAVWMYGDVPRPTAALIAKTIAGTRRDVEKIRARGGDVVFLRPPSSGAVLELERTAVPRDAGWEPLLRETRSLGVHFEDYPDMQGLDIPEWSHLSRASATRFTRAYVTVLANDADWLRGRTGRDASR